MNEKPFLDNGFLRIGVIMAGGSGERFWPMSRRLRPKQLLELATPGMTLLDESISRISPVIDPESLLIITSQDLERPILHQKTAVPDSNILAEPNRRNTAGCLAFAAAQILNRFPNVSPESISIAVLTADHHINNINGFAQTVRLAFEDAEQNKKLVTIGIQPERPETGYGYIEITSQAKENNQLLCPVKRFHEKPSYEDAIEYVSSGRFFWNSGMFFWRLDQFLEQLAKTSPIHVQSIQLMTQAMQNENADALINAFNALPDISIDYALMEKSENVSMVRAQFDWDDVGAWDAFGRNRVHDSQGNVIEGNCVIEDCQECVIINELDSEKMDVATIGLKGMVVVVTDGGVLVMPKSRAQDIKKAINELKRRGSAHL